MDTLLILIMAGAAGLSFMLSGMEAGVFAVNRWRLRRQARTSKGSAQLVIQYLEKPEDFLWTILVGNTLANVTLWSIGVMLLYQRLWRWPALLILSLAAGVLVIYAFCELLPKMLFRLFPNRLSIVLARPFHMIHSVLRPLVLLTAFIANTLVRWSGGKRFTGDPFGSREEFRLAMQESGKDLTSEERAMINRVLDLQTLRAGHVLVPLSRVRAVEGRTPITDVLAICREHKLSRLPVWSDAVPRRLDRVLSLSNVLFREDGGQSGTAGDYARPALLLNADTRLETALREMQRRGHPIAIVVDRDNRPAGLVSLQDILKVIFGEVAW